MAALILSIAILCAVGIIIYFSPYNICVRALSGQTATKAEIRCLEILRKR